MHGFYDVEKAKLRNIYEGENLMHREPEDDFERYLNAVVPLLHPGRDVVWVLCGRTESNINKLRKVRLQVGDAIGVSCFKGFKTYLAATASRCVAPSATDAPVFTRSLSRCCSGALGTVPCKDGPMQREPR